MWQKHLPGLVASLVLFYSHSGYAQIATYDVRLGNLLHMQQGIGWPLYLNVVEGNEALMRLSEHLENQQACEVTTPGGVTFNVKNPPSKRYEAWSDGCGVRVKNVVSADVGRWRMTASRGNNSITGWSEVNVADQITSYTPGAISLHDGQTHTQVVLSSLNNSYCLVAQPFSDSKLVSGHCRVTLDRTTRAVQGRWSVILGIPGRVSELQVDMTVAVEAERLDVGYVREADERKLHLYCNILHTTKNITFCRFQQTTQTSGFNVMDGLSDGRYSYYGHGVFKKQCGLTIELVTAEDYGTWRCTIGVMDKVDNVIQHLTPMQALITVPVEDGGTRIRRDIQRSENDIRKIFVQKESDLTITCRADASLGYCWFRHPNGSQFSPVERQFEDGQDFWYTGQNLQSGDCGITFTKVSINDTGIWTCHMGYKYQLGVEKMDQIDVRVTGPLAANEQEVDAVDGGSVTLYCHTSNGPRPLDYCRFLSPKNIGMSLDSTVDAQNAILDRFYFTPDRSLDYGDCSLTINPVYEEDFGEWTCAALLHDYAIESKATVSLYANAARMPRLRAGLIGTSVGVAVLALVLAVTVWYKKGRPLPCSWPNPVQRFGNQSDSNSFSLEAPNDSEDRRSSGSTTSSNELQEERA